MTANVTVVTARRDDALRVPATALRFRPQVNNNGAKSAASSTMSGGSGGANAARSQGERTHRKAKADSLQSRAEGTSGVVYVKGAKGAPEPREVRIGLNDGTFAEILSGEVLPGDSVIVGMYGKTSTTSGMVPGMGPSGPPRR
jgi:HlyD family secretion protein